MHLEVAKSLRYIAVRYVQVGPENSRVWGLGPAAAPEFESQKRGKKDMIMARLARSVAGYEIQLCCVTECAEVIQPGLLQRTNGLIYHNGKQ